MPVALSATCLLCAAISVSSFTLLISVCSFLCVLDRYFIALGSCFILSGPPVPDMLCLGQTLTCCPLRSTVFPPLHHYYETIRLLTGLWNRLDFLRLACSYLSDRSLSDLPGTPKIPCMLATLSDPGGISPGKAYPQFLLPAALMSALASASRSNEAELLHAFALRLSCSPAYA